VASGRHRVEKDQLAASSDRAGRQKGHWRVTGPAAHAFRVCVTRRAARVMRSHAHMRTDGAGVV
jgi:hypothetical protein